jgi:hypothetical protein
LYAHKNNCKKQLVGKEDNKEKKKEEKREKAAQIGTNVRASISNAGLLATSQFAS